MKISAKKLNEMIRSAVRANLKEDERTLDTMDDKELRDFLDRADKDLAKCLETMAKLAEDAEAMVREDLETKDRKAALLLVTGLAKRVHGMLVGAIEQLKVSTG